jgi:hypothetical protein
MLTFFVMEMGRKTIYSYVYYGVVPFVIIYEISLLIYLKFIKVDNSKGFSLLLILYFSLI